MEINDNPCTSKKKKNGAISFERCTLHRHTHSSLRLEQWSKELHFQSELRFVCAIYRFRHIAFYSGTTCVCVLCVCMMEESGDDVMPYQEMVPNAN